MKKVLKWVGLGLGTLVLLVAVLIGVLYMRGSAVLTDQVAVPDEDFVTAAADSATLAWGGHLVASHGCQKCHGEQLEGVLLGDAPPFTLVATNLTAGQGGVGADYTDADWERAIRHGVNKAGRGLFVMPSDAYQHLSDSEMHAMIAYLKSVPAVDNELPPMNLKPLGRVLAGAGEIRPITTLVRDEAHAEAPPLGPTAEFGAYRAKMCQACHGADLRGGPHPEPGAPYSPSLIAAKHWTPEQFIETMRTGMRPSGAAMDDTYMPWSAFGKMTDDELRAIHAYLQTLPDDAEMEQTD